MARILIVEDEEKIARFVTLELEHESYQVEHAADGRTAVDLALERDYDLILLDVLLPQLNGMEVLRRVRKHKDVPVIMVTARDAVMDKVAGLDAGADDYLTKPFAIEELFALIRVAADGASYEIVADEPVRPTSELPAHLSVHDYLVGAGRPERAVVHTHPIELVAMTHNPEFLGKDVLTRLLWSMIPETRAFCPKGLGIVPYTLPGSQELADRTIALLDDYDVVMWTKHGALAIGTDLIEAFDQIDVLSKSAKIYESARSMGFVPTGMSDAEMQELKEVFGL